MEKKEKVSFEENIKELENIVKSLESGEVALDEAIDKFKEAINIANQCDKKLKEAQDSVNKILNKDGKLEEFSIEENNQ